MTAKAKRLTNWSVIAPAVAAGKDDAGIVAAYREAFGPEALPCSDYIDTLRTLLVENPRAFARALNA